MAAKKKAVAKKKPAPKKKKAAAPKPKKLLKATPAIKAAAVRSAKKAAKGARIKKTAGYDVPKKAPSVVTLYGNQLSLPVAKVALMLNMLGVKFAYKHVDLMAGAQKSPEFGKLNRFHQVPVLRDGDETVVQSNVILAYLAERYGAFGGGQAHERRRVAEWLSWEADRMPSLGQTRFLRRMGGQNAPAIPFLFMRGEASLELLDRHLGTSKFVAGPNPTIADIAIFPWIATAEEGQFDAAKYPNVRDWGQRMMKIPGVAHPYALVPKEDRAAG
jgi:glutathione S-transferase